MRGWFESRFVHSLWRAATTESRTMKVGYVVEQYPLHSVPFIVDEILAHEEAGLEIEVYSLRPSTDSRFLASISRVRAPVRYLSTSGSGSAEQLWTQMQDAGRSFPDFWSRLSNVRERDVRTIAQAIELARLVGRNGISHLHAHFATAPTTVARLAAGLADISYTFTAHTEDLFSADVDDLDLEVKIRDAAGTITVNDFGLEYIRQAFGPAATRVQRIYNGIRTEVLPFMSPAGRPRLVVAVGPLEETSGFEFLIGAVAQLIKRGQHLHCHIMGAGSLESELEDLIIEHNLRESVKLLVTASQEDIRAEIRSAAILVAPCVVAADGSTGEDPGVLLEAMTVGTPCVSTDVGGIPEIIVDGQTGIQVPQRDADALSTTIERLLTDDVLRVRLALKARVLVESEFNIHRNTEQMRSFFGPGRRDGSASGASQETQETPTKQATHVRSGGNGLQTPPAKKNQGLPA